MIKLADYKSTPELAESGLIHSNQILVERFQCKSDNLWVSKIYRTRDTIDVASIGFTCAIAVRYEHIAQLL